MKKPELHELEEYCQSRNNGIDPCAWIDYYDSVGWLIGKKPMKDWKAAVRTWERKNKEWGIAKAKALPPSVVENMNDRSWAD